MQRPLMDPMFVNEFADVTRAPLPLWRWSATACKWIVRTLFKDLMAATAAVSRPAPWKVLARAGIYWAVLLPILLVGLAAVLVGAGTHPTPPPSLRDPASLGLYFEPVNLVSDDGVHLSGWLVQGIDARRVLDEKDRSLKARRPGIVLAHDFGQSPQQMLPLLRTLHEEGVVVLVVGLRGAGSESPNAQTFGCRESLDVQAGVELLRHTPFLDPKRIAVGGIGTGASAALLAASRDKAIRGVVVINPVRNVKDALAERIGPRASMVSWMRPICRAVFELSTGADVKELSMDHFDRQLAAPNGMVISNADPAVLSQSATLRELRSFCRHTLHSLDGRGR